MTRNSRIGYLKRKDNFIVILQSTSALYIVFISRLYILFDLAADAFAEFSKVCR